MAMTIQRNFTYRLLFLSFKRLVLHSLALVRNEVSEFLAGQFCDRSAKSWNLNADRKEDLVVPYKCGMR